MCWDEKIDWPDLRNYETAVQGVINNHRMIALCSYNLDKLKAVELIDVVRNHQIVLSRREYQWEAIKRDENTLAKAAEKRRKKEKFGISDTLTTCQAAKFLGLHVNTVRRWSQMGILKCHRIGSGRHRRFLRKDLERFSLFQRSLAPK